MKRFGKYLVAYRLALSRALVFRTNLLLGSVNVLVWFGSLILLYRAIGGSLGSYSTAQLVTYVLGTSILTNLLFTSVMDQMATEIFEGDLVNYLLRPINYFYYWIARAAATRSVLFVIAAVEILLLAHFVSSEVLLQWNPWILIQTVVLLIGSLALMTLFDFIGASFSFWTGRNFGSRWLITICLRFLSGAAIPITLMPRWAQTIMNATPFPSLVAVPVQSYLGNTTGTTFVATLLTQWGWIAVLSILLALLWRRGTRIYAAYGN